VEAADGGVVAYTGNELRGYGNLILVKHTNGWISAYAHCDQILVKRGDKVARGQTIAHVGSTGNVSEPQLHFELRRGNHAVDPREFLAPLPTAGAEKSPPPG
jgi:murein DD-endopeptidase MepM/ murein hydrolase activator NlpD